MADSTGTGGDKRSASLLEFTALLPLRALILIMILELSRAGASVVTRSPRSKVRASVS